MTNEEKYRRALYLIDALCVGQDLEGDSPEEKFAGTVYRLAHTAHGLCKSSVCGDVAHESLVKECEAALVAGNVCATWEDEKRRIETPECLQSSGGC